MSSIMPAEQRSLAQGTGLSHDLLGLIMTFLTDKEAGRFACTCREMSEFAKDRGYLRRIEFRLGDDPLAFHIACSRHRHTLRTVVIDSLNAPQFWCPLLTRATLVKASSYGRDTKYPDGEYQFGLNPPKGGEYQPPVARPKRRRI